MNHEEYLEEYQLYLESERRLSPHTIRAYLQDVRAFIKESKIQNLSEAEETKAFFTFVQKKRERGVQDRSILRMMISLRQFFSFLLKEGWIQSNPLAFFELPKIEKTLPNCLSEEQVEQLLTMPNSREKVGVRDYAILLLLYATGIRVSELCGINRGDLGKTELKVIGKGRKERVAPIPLQVYEKLMEYAKVWKLEMKEYNAPFFLSSKGKRIDRFLIWKRIRGYATRCGIEELSPHTLRHTFATHLLIGGGDLRVIQELLGHADISTTDLYTHIVDRQLQESFHQFHPRS